jgi:galactose mutarotase-like enzyme
MKEIYLNHTSAKAIFKTRGAELCSFSGDGIEYIWQGNPAIWNRHAPVLFPIVGRLKEDTYFVNGKSYQLPQHGFARDREFQVLSKSDTSVSFLLKSDLETLKVYPFQFRLIITYTLSGSSLKVKYTVENPSEENILFSIGAHPGFNCPLFPEREAFEGYEIDFYDGSSYKELNPLAGSLLSHKKSTIQLQKGKLKLDYNLFENDALIFDATPPQKISVKNSESGKGYSLQYKGFRWLGLWTKQPGAGFICLEPWNGIADTVNHDQDFSSKLGINSLAPGDKYEVYYQLDII